MSYANPDQEAVGRLAEAYATAFASNKVDQVLACMTEDFVAVTPDKPPVVGKTAVKAAITQDFTHMHVIALHFSPDEIFTTGEWGFARGSSGGTIRTLPDQNLVKLKGKFLWILRKENGAWKVARDSAFGDQPSQLQDFIVGSHPISLLRNHPISRERSHFGA